ncbi:alternative oxidase, mitochondrial [Aplysia californica]|uniref:Alternative oxidase, mitochondrial n=1 Tax=Aplysia californica TaxID=6500 RepID=A0ABM0JQI0_APLCA|nr:alternative oxidase, mitochondrial [Aplysia californica]
MMLSLPSTMRAFAAHGSNFSPMATAFVTSTTGRSFSSSVSGTVRSSSKTLPIRHASCVMCTTDQAKPAHKVTSSFVGLQQYRGLADKKEINEKVDEYRKGDFDTIPDPGNLVHFKTKDALEKTPKTDVQDKGKKDKEMPPIGTYVLPHPIWTEEQLHDVQVTHKEPEGFVDKAAHKTVMLFRGGFDIFSGFKFGQRNERKWLNRICFLETVAGVPGMVAAMMRHMRSLRRMQRDQGWIHTLLEEAENERMHLLTALQLKKPSLFFRLCVIGSQGVFVTMFGVSYIISPKFCHRFVGYLEEEAVKTYTKCLEDINDGPMQHWKTQPAPDVAIRYWKLSPEATMKDVILAIRADEAHHRVVNHSLASLKKDEFNPYKPGK